MRHIQLIRIILYLSKIDKNEAIFLATQGLDNTSIKHKLLKIMIQYIDKEELDMT